MSRRGRNSKLLVHPTPIGMQIGIGQVIFSAMIADGGGWFAGVESEPASTDPVDELQPCMHVQLDSM